MSCVEEKLHLCLAIHSCNNCNHNFNHCQRQSIQKPRFKLQYILSSWFCCVLGENRLFLFPSLGTITLNRSRNARWFYHLPLQRTQTETNIARDISIRQKRHYSAHPSLQPRWVFKFYVLDVGNNLNRT